MQDVLWVTISWPVWFFVVALALSVIVIVKFAPAAGLLLLSLVLYNGTAWDEWFGFMSNLYWLAFLVGLTGLVWGLVSGGGRPLAIWGSGIAVFFAVVLLNSNLFGDSDPDEQISPNMSQLQEEKDSREWVDDRLQQRIDNLSERLDLLESNQ